MIGNVAKLIAVVVLLGIGSSCLAACGGPDSVIISEAWARPSDVGMTSAVYFTIDNPTGESDALVGVEAGVADGAEIHMSVMDEALGEAMDGMDPDMGGEVMRMVPQERVDVPPESRVVFEPGGLHVMLIGVRQEIQEGDKIAVVLQFEQAGDISIDVPIEIR